MCQIHGRGVILISHFAEEVTFPKKRPRINRFVIKGLKGNRWLYFSHTTSCVNPTIGSAKSYPGCAVKS